jgi:hypothetical protein
VLKSFHVIFLLLTLHVGLEIRHPHCTPVTLSSIMHQQLHGVTWNLIFFPPQSSSRCLRTSKYVRPPWRIPPPGHAPAWYASRHAPPWHGLPRWSRHGHAPRDAARIPSARNASRNAPRIPSARHAAAAKLDRHRIGEETRRHAHAPCYRGRGR